jgi:DNA-binding phage protein
MDAESAHDALLATFATNVRRRADELGVPLTQVSERAGIPRAVLLAVTSATQSPTWITMAKVGAALGCSVIDLLVE